ncbi:MAG: hypothetical protein RIB45_15140 [Marivibrio sp.]|uniref:hypothetical protein n=1 Tax=Marivibrio sp. TaxID=2039719 RepID=UPI0032ED0EFB
MIDIPHAAPHLTLMDVERAPDGALCDYGFRLAGTRIVETEGGCTGKRLLEIFPDRRRYEPVWRHFADAIEGRL